MTQNTTYPNEIYRHIHFVESPGLTLSFHYNSERNPTNSYVLTVYVNTGMTFSQTFYTNFTLQLRIRPFTCHFFLLYTNKYVYTL